MRKEQRTKHQEEPGPLANPNCNKQSLLVFVGMQWRSHAHGPSPNSTASCFFGSFSETRCVLGSNRLVYSVLEPGHKVLWCGYC
jgi:hypothetical protein